jgi:hypothetical protein
MFRGYPFAMDRGQLAGDLQIAIDRALSGEHSGEHSGERLTVDEAETLVSATGADLERLLDASARLRDEGLARAGRPGVITYSKKVFLPITTLCRDRCHYCIFVDTPGKLATKGKPLYMSPDQILDVARLGASMGCKEALFTLATDRRTGGRPPGPGSTTTATRRRCTTCGRWRSSCSTRRGCSRT